MSGTKTGGGGLGTAVAAVVVLVIAGMVMANLERTPGDTDLPPDPFESDEPRVVDCVLSWDGWREGVTADTYCEVGSPDNSDDQTELDRSPYIWSTTGNSGQVAIVDMHLSRADSGLCELWIDGELFETEPVVQVLDDEGEVPFYGCAIEEPIP